METLLVPGRAKTFVRRIYDDDSVPVDGLNVVIRLLRASNGGLIFEYRHDTNSWAEYDPSDESWGSMVGQNNGTGLYLFNLPGSLIEAWYGDEIIVMFKIFNYPEAGDIYSDSEAYKIIEKVIEVLSPIGAEGYIYIDQDGWVDCEGVKHYWTDDLKGYIHDSMGERVAGAFITAFTVVDGVPIISGMPTWQSKSKWDGNWNGWILSGTYQFNFFAEHRINDSVVRTIG